MRNIVKLIVAGSLLLSTGYGYADELDKAAWQAETELSLTNQKHQALATVRQFHSDELKRSLAQGQQAVIADMTERQLYQQLTMPDEIALQVASQESGLVDGE
ncbi:hypothetical protein [Photobacterium satsumensis]|uniref:hypothetical protein n=1 Tax=Photobacterium satsumensis TaxID=2910239 RepID=UPI003D1327B9